MGEKTTMSAPGCLTAQTAFLVEVVRQPSFMVLTYSSSSGSPCRRSSTGPTSTQELSRRFSAGETRYPARGISNPAPITVATAPITQVMNFRRDPVGEDISSTDLLSCSCRLLV